MKIWWHVFCFFIDYLDKPGHPRKNAVSFHFHHFINISITFTSPSFWRIEWTDIGGVWNGTYVPWYVRFSHWILLSLSIPFLTFTFSILFGVLFHHKIQSAHEYQPFIPHRPDIVIANGRRFSTPLSQWKWTMHLPFYHPKVCDNTTSPK